MSLLRYEEAAGHYERALAGLRALGGGGGDRLPLLVRFGNAQRLAGDGEGARATLGQHLAATVRTGLVCAYDPSPGSAPRWEF